MPTSTAERAMDNATGTPSLEEAMQRGVAAAQRGERDEANRIFRETVEAYPEAVDVWVWLGGTTPDLDEAEMAFEQARTLDPNNEKAALGLRWVQLRRNGPQAAYQPITGASVPVPTQPAWDQGPTAQLETVANEAMPAVPVVAESPSEPATSMPAGTASASDQPETRAERSIPSAVMWVALAIFVILLAALGYWYFFVR